MNIFAFLHAFCVTCRGVGMLDKMKSDYSFSRLSSHCNICKEIHVCHWHRTVRVT